MDESIARGDLETDSDDPARLLRWPATSVRDTLEAPRG
jgi:hypothetical protein